MISTTPPSIGNYGGSRKKDSSTPNGRPAAAARPVAVYNITDAGEEMLQGWTQVVTGYQKMITGFFDLYGQVFGITPPTPAEERPEPSQEEPATQDSD